MSSNLKMRRIQMTNLSKEWLRLQEECPALIPSTPDLRYTHEEWVALQEAQKEAKKGPSAP
jgi:hypothetical protein